MLWRVETVRLLSMTATGKWSQHPPQNNTFNKRKKNVIGTSSMQTYSPDRDRQVTGRNKNMIGSVEPQASQQHGTLLRLTANNL